jgi:hypothetical protein
MLFMLSKDKEELFMDLEHKTLKFNYYLLKFSKIYLSQYLLNFKMFNKKKTIIFNLKNYLNFKLIF